MSMIESKEDQARASYHDSKTGKTISISLSPQALKNLEKHALELGMKRNEFIRQLLYGVAFKDQLCA